MGDSPSPHSFCIHTDRHTHKPQATTRPEQQKAPGGSVTAAVHSLPPRSRPRRRREAYISWRTYLKSREHHLPATVAELIRIHVHVHVHVRASMVTHILSGWGVEGRGVLARQRDVGERSERARSSDAESFPFRKITGLADVRPHGERGIQIFLLSERRKSTASSAAWIRMDRWGYT